MNRKVYRSLAEAPPVFVPVEDAERSLDADAAWFEEHLGPDVPAQLLNPRGRPRKGTKVAKTTSHTVRLADSVWEAAQSRAKELGISTNAAVQLAVAGWAAAKR